MILELRYFTRACLFVCIFLNFLSKMQASIIRCLSRARINCECLRQEGHPAYKWVGGDGGGGPVVPMGWRPVRLSVLGFCSCYLLLYHKLRKMVYNRKKTGITPWAPPHTYANRYSFSIPHRLAAWVVLAWVAGYTVTPKKAGYSPPKILN